MVNFPEVRRELLDLAERDQVEIRGHYLALQKLSTDTEKEQQNRLLAVHCHKRAGDMLAVLKKIDEKPTIANIGLDGSKAVSLLALHSYKSLMHKILKIYETVYKEEPGNIYTPAIPPLTDRIMILEKRQQLFGTNWAVSETGEYFLIPVKDFEDMNKQRARYGLEPAQRPTVLSFGAPKKHPLGKDVAKASDQKPLTDEEYEEYSRYSLKSLV